MCRAIGPIVTSDGEPFEDYVRSALVDEMKLAGIYSANSKAAIVGHLAEADFSSSGGIWTLELDVSLPNNRQFTVAEQYSYQTSFYGETACNQTAQALLPAVQDLLKQVLNHPQFVEFVSSA